ncbi:protein transport protein Sec61 subunit beta [Andrographis paniculata]|uniref:protein transport protein Sec61 subunit beta n=1 Tax=Andrographis paniculata TaxID=175694 RepID=UPI0021E84905|nr:protein transport protein Sec61 subunit beta [Andrographis paniculata]
MGRGSSQSQNPTASTNRPDLKAPRGSAAASAGMRRRRLGAGAGAGGSSSSSSAALGGPGAGNMLRFYTDDSPGLKIGPNVVLIMSICFITFVAALHVVGKFYRVRPGS